ncbi:MAG: sigma-70 family RNA polymerase sigma factor [Clostridia bacterium]|nr:sigma-70 family RNA polymerase sigma factor [Clostridia bacterium]
MNSADNAVQLNELISSVKNGNQQAFSQILEKYRPMLISLVSKYENDDLTKSLFEDLLQEAMVVFYNAILNYDQTQTEVEFGLYARICVSNALVTQIRAINKRRAECSTAFSMQDVRKEDLLEDLEKEIISKENLSTIYKVIKSNLSDYENTIWHHYMMGRTAKEIGALMRSNEKSVANAIYRIRKKLRTLLK